MFDWASRSNMRFPTVPTLVTSHKSENLQPWSLSVRLSYPSCLDWYRCYFSRPSPTFPKKIITTHHTKVIVWLGKFYIKIFKITFNLNLSFVWFYLTFPILKNYMRKFILFCLSSFLFSFQVLGSRMEPWSNYLSSYNKDQRTIDAPTILIPS